MHFLWRNTHTKRSTSWAKKNLRGLRIYKGNHLQLLRGTSLASSNSLEVPLVLSLFSLNCEKFVGNLWFCRFSLYVQNLTYYWVLEINLMQVHQEVDLGADFPYNNCSDIDINGKGLGQFENHEYKYNQIKFVLIVCIFVC